MVFATCEQDTLVSAFFSVSFVVRGAVFRLLLAGMSSWCEVVVFGCTYGPVNPLFLLTGHGIIVSTKRGVGCGSSSSAPLFLFRFPRFSIKVCTCCLEEDSGGGLLGILLLFVFFLLYPTSSVDPVRDAAFRLPLAAKAAWCVLVVVGFTYSPVNPLFLLAGLGVIVSIERVVRRGCSSSDPLVLLCFPRFSIKVSTCCLEEDPGVGLWGTWSLFGFLWLCHTSSVDPVWVWRL